MTKKRFSKQEVFDYQSICNKSTTKAERTVLYIGDIWSNKAQCLRCLDIIRSVNKHHFVTCSCGGLSVDGGSHYLKRNGEWSSYLEMAEMFDDVK